MKKAIYLFLALILLGACGGPETNVSYRTVEVKDQYSIKIPDYMNSTNQLNDEASLQYMNGFKEAYIIIIDEPKDSFVQIYQTIDQYNDSISISENYKNTQLESFKTYVKDFNLYDENIVDFNEKPSYSYKVDGTVENIDITYFFRFVEGKEDLYMIMGWTEQWRKPTYENTFKQILSSFSEL
jgi:hypothetical protein